MRLHPNLATVYKQKVGHLRDALNEPSTRIEAANILRGLVDEIRLIPEAGELRIHLIGQLAALFSMAQNDLRPGPTKTGPQVTLVAGIGFEPMTFRL